MIKQPYSVNLPHGDVARPLALHDALSHRASQSLLVVRSRLEPKRVVQTN